MISVIVVAYNLENIIIPTLESVARQSFSDFELIITDDGSQDRTLEVVSQWCEQNLDPKKNPYKIVSNPGHEKRGIAGNYNRGLKVATREWVKFIDGDDLLADDCLENNMNFVLEDPARKVVFSKMRSFEKEVDNEDHIPQEFPYQRHYKFFNLSAKEQYKYFLVDSFNAAPVTFLNRELINELGGYDDRFFIQDLPLWLKLTSNGIKIHFLPKVTAYYRVNFGVSSSQSYIFSPIFYSSYKDMHEIMIVPNVPIYKLSFWNKYFLFRLKYRIAHKFFDNSMSENSKKLMKALDFLSVSHSLNVFKGKILKLIRA